MGVQKKIRKFVKVIQLIMSEEHQLRKAPGEKNNRPTGFSIVGFKHEKFMCIPRQLILLQEEESA